MKPPDQEYTSANTCIHTLPALFRKVGWEEGTVNLDIGGGKYNDISEFLESRGVANIVWDPYNRSGEHNEAAIELLDELGAVDTATLSNVLNVVKEDHIRTFLISFAYRSLKPGGELYITCYRGKGDTGKPTTKGWQENRPLRSYIEEVAKIFHEVEIVNEMIVARRTS